VITAFYSAHHYIHALLARHAHLLPDEEREVRGRPVKVTHAHPGSHRHVPGGTHFSLEVLASRLPGAPELESLVPVFKFMLEDSQTARYGGSRGTRLTTMRKVDADQALDYLDQVVSIILPRLS